MGTLSSNFLVDPLITCILANTASQVVPVELIHRDYLHTWVGFKRHRISIIDAFNGRQSHAYITLDQKPVSYCSSSPPTSFPPKFDISTFCHHFASWTSESLDFPSPITRARCRWRRCRLRRHVFQTRAHDTTVPTEQFTKGLVVPAIRLGIISAVSSFKERCGFMLTHFQNGGPLRGRVLSAIFDKLFCFLGLEKYFL